jgi:hypothetical protein
MDESLEQYSVGPRWTLQRGWVLVAAGQLRGTLGDHGAALAAFAEVLALSRQSGDRFFVPVALQGMARACRHLDRLDEAAELLGAAQGLAEQLGIVGGPADVAARERGIARLRNLLGDDAFEAHWESGRAMSFDAGVALAAEVAVTPVPEPDRPLSPGADQSANVFRREGDTWTISYEGASLRLRDAKGLQYLARLLAQPGTEIHVSDLAAETTGEALSASRSGGEVLDASAKRAYKERLNELKTELTEASEWNDIHRMATAQAEIDTLTDQLAGAYGLGGRPRRMGDSVERVRKAVTNRLRDSLERISAEHQALGLHLSNALHTGTFCSYTPERPITWEF